MDREALPPAESTRSLRDIFEWFDQTRMINLRDRTDRLKDSMSELKRAGINTDHPRFSVFSAVRPQDAGEFPSIGARGSFTSHREILREAVAAGKRNVLVLEDDIRFKRVDEIGISHILRQLNEEPWDIVYFGLLSPVRHGQSPTMELWDGPTIGGHFYGIREPYLSSMLEYMDACEQRASGDPLGGPMFRDGAYNHFREHVGGIKVYIVTPTLAGQRSSRTDLHDLPLWDRVPVMREGATVLRRLLNHLRSRK